MEFLHYVVTSVTRISASCWPEEATLVGEQQDDGILTSFRISL